MSRRSRGRATKARPRQQPQRQQGPRPATTTPFSPTATEEPAGYPDVAMAEAAPTPAAPPTQRAQPAASSRRTAAAAAARRGPTMTVNYRYLNRDLRTLGVLAPGMVIVLILAFIFLH